LLKCLLESGVKTSLFLFCTMSYLDFTSITDLISRGLSITESNAWTYSISKSEIQREIIRLNQEQLYEDGIDSKNGSLGVYRPFTIERKKSKGVGKGRRNDHVTLYDQGDFYASMKVTYDSDSFEVTADDSSKYDRPLFEIYGEDVVGLTPFNLERIRNFIVKYYAEYIDKKLFY